MYNQNGTSTGPPVLKIVIMPDICQYRTSTKCQHRQPVRDQHWSTRAENRYHARHMPVPHHYQMPTPTTSTGPSLTDQCRTSLSSPTYASADTSTVCQLCARCKFLIGEACIFLMKTFLLNRLFGQSILDWICKQGFAEIWIIIISNYFILYSLFYSIEKFQNSFILNYLGTFTDKMRSKLIYNFLTLILFWDF